MKALFAVLIVMANLLGGILFLGDALSQSGGWAAEDARSQAAAAELSKIMPYLK